MVKEDELVKSFRDLNLGVVLTLHSLRLNQLRVTSDFKGQIAQAQMEEEDFLKTIALVGKGKLKGSLKVRMDYRGLKEEFAYPRVETSEGGFWRRLTRAISPYTPV